MREKLHLVSNITHSSSQTSANKIFEFIHVMANSYIFRHLFIPATIFSSEVVSKDDFKLKYRSYVSQTIGIITEIFKLSSDSLD